jgi:hypothetical protein
MSRSSVLRLPRDRIADITAERFRFEKTSDMGFFRTLCHRWPPRQRLLEDGAESRLREMMIAGQRL